MGISEEVFWESTPRKIIALIDQKKEIEKVKSKTFSESFLEQLEVSEKLYGLNLKLHFTKKDIEELLSNEETFIYSKEVKERVKEVLFEQMRKYSYLF